MRHDPEPTPAALEKRRQPGRLRAIVLAVLVHLAFFALIVFGITWQNPPSAPVQAELWDKLPAKPAVTPPKAQPKPAPKPAPKPEPPPPKPPEPKPPEPKPEEVKPPEPKPDAAAIAEKIKREKRAQEEREKAEKQAREKAEKQARERLEKQKAEEARKKREQEEAARKKLEEEKRRQEEERAKAEAEQARAAAAGARQAEIDGWVNKIKNKIRSRANIPDTVTGKPEVKVRIRVLPGGDVLDIAIVKSSGNRVYDTAIERAIRSAQPLPVPDVNSELFPQFRDLILNIEHDR